MELNKEKIESIIESLLFVWGDPLSLEDISEVLVKDIKEVEKVIDNMMKKYETESRGLQITKTNNYYQIGTKPENYEWIEKLNKPIKERGLSNAALETLSIIAYKQPVIKPDIEAIRGVKCDSAIYNLLDKGLIEEVGRLDRIGRPILYGTTELFLHTFGLESLKDLPSLKDSEEFKNIAIEEVDKKLKDEEDEVEEA